jgi:beta-carotene 3-hydroxylase
MASAALNLTAFLIGLIGMEGVAWATHRYLMHGPLWSWHRCHHEPGGGRGPELNDLFGLVFSGLAIALFAIGAWRGIAALTWLAAGVTAYGALYLLAHDGLVHQRFPFPRPSDGGYLARLVQAHHLHHRTRGRLGAVSFGFLLAQDPQRLIARLGASEKA